MRHGEPRPDPVGVCGFLSPEALIQSVSGGSRAEAVKFVQLGMMLAAAQDAAAQDAVVRDTEAADGTGADALYRRAREIRDDLNDDGIVRCETQRRELRYFAAKRRPDGKVVGSYLLSDGGVDHKPPVE